jgi:hypothetical protein
MRGLHVLHREDFRTTRRVRCGKDTKQREIVPSAIHLQRVSPSTTSSARSSSSEVSRSTWPMTRRIRSRRRAIILSVIICERRRRPFDGLASIIGLSERFSCRSDEIGQIKIVDSPSLNSSACAMTPGLGLPGSLGTTTSTTSPRFTSTRSNHRPPRSRHRSRRFPDAVPSSLSHGVFARAPWDCANPAPNAAPAAAPARANARAAKPCAAAGCGVLTCWASWSWKERNMLRRKFQREPEPQLSTFSAAIKASCGMSTLPNCRIFFLPSFCFSRSFLLRVMSPP